MSLERYVTVLEKLVLEAGIDAVVKRDIFISELNKYLLTVDYTSQIHLKKY